MPTRHHTGEHARASDSAARKTSAPNFTPTPAKPFEATVGRILFSLDQGANQRFGAALDRCPSWVSRLKDPHDATHIRASDVAHVCQALGEVTPVNELFRGVRIGGCEWRMAPVAEAAAPEDVRASAFDLAGSAGACVAALGRALADGEISRVERAVLHAQLDDLRVEVEALSAALGGRS